MSILDDHTMKATQLSPRDGLIVVPAGPPGLGKSWFAGTMAEYLDPEEILLIGTLPREVKSTKYQEYDLDTVLIYDGDWLPDEGSFKADGFDNLQDLLKELREDEKYKGIIIDNGTEAAEMAWHKALEPHGVGDPAQLSGRGKFDPYTQLDSYMDQFTRNLLILAGGVPSMYADLGLSTTEVAQPKLICIPWHVQPLKESMTDDDTADEKGEGTEYEGKNLPMIRGRFRRRLQQVVDGLVYVDYVSRIGPGMETRMEYVLQVRSDNERHCKFPGELPEDVGKHIEPHFEEFMRYVPERKEDEDA